MFGVGVVLHSCLCLIVFVSVSFPVSRSLSGRLCRLDQEIAFNHVPWPQWPFNVPGVWPGQLLVIRRRSELHASGLDRFWSQRCSPNSRRLAWLC